MEVRVYDLSLNLIHIVENFTSLLWKRKYNECGTFTLNAPASEKNIDAFKMGRVVWVQGKADAGLIEGLTIQYSNGVNTMEVTGRFMPGVMDNRLTNTFLNDWTETADLPSKFFSGRVETIMRDMFTQAASFPNIVLGADNGFTDEVEFQALFKSLLTYEQNLAKSANFGFRFRPDITNGRFVFEIYKGVDRSENQSDRPRVVFSEEYENLSGATYKNNSQLWKTVCQIGGQSNQTYKYYKIVGDDTATGYDRRETYYEATDVESNGLTWDQYVAALIAKGEMVLEQSQDSETFECTVLANGNFVYLRDYDVGDIVTVKKKTWGLEKDLRITEVTEVYETEKPKVELVLGTPLPTTINWEV